MGSLDERAMADRMHVHAIQQLSREMELFTQAVQSLHDMQSHTQALLCALVDTHPQPAKASETYEKYLARIIASDTTARTETFETLLSAWRVRFSDAQATQARDALMNRLKQNPSE